MEAPAGSGKTGLLIQRFLKLLAADTVTDPSQVLAITFTRKATAEMRDRVLAQLQAAHENVELTNDFDRLTRFFSEAVLAQDRRRGWNLLDAPHRLNIHTIDSVCNGITRSLPVLSGSAGSLTPREDAHSLHREAARRTLMLLGGDDHTLSSAIESILLHRDADLANCESLITTMLQTRDQWADLIPLAADQLSETYLDTIVLPKLEKALDQAICRSLTRFSHTVPQRFIDTLCTLAADMGHVEGYKGNPSPIAMCAGRYATPGEKAEHLDHWRALIGLLLTKEGGYRKRLNINEVGFMIEKSHQEALMTLIREVRDDESLCENLCSIRSLPPAHYPVDQWQVSKALFRVLSRALVELQLVFADRNQCDFIEPVLLARAALRNNTALNDLALATGQSLQHLLVDEMQDTSTTQYELIQLLTQRWDGHSQTVFLVGDPKQSIYLFRQARVERFLNTMQKARLGDLPLGVLRLTANFRSQATLVEHFNQDFSRLFPAQPDRDRPELVPYLAASPSRPPNGNAARLWHADPLPYSDSADTGSAKSLLHRQQAAAEIRELAARWLQRALPARRTKPWKLAVLVRNRTHLLEIVAAFRQAPSIPFRAVQIEPLRERQEILDLLALTRALLHPADRIAWLAVLRTPWCGLTLADLHLLTGADDTRLSKLTVVELIQTRGELLSEDGIARLEPLWSILSDALTQRGRLPLSQWVERTWRSFNAHAFCSEEELANVNEYLNLIDQIESPGVNLDLALLDQRLVQLYAAPAVHPGAVDLMTIHGAKGLEWDVVFVPALERTAAIRRNKLLSWLEVDGSPDLDDETIAHGILAPIQSKGTASKELQAWMRSIDTAGEAAELKRLFYVACTRAREELHLFASPSARQDGTLALTPTSLLAAAWPAAEEHFQAAIAPSVEPYPISPEPPGQTLDRLAAAAQPQPRTILRIPLHTFNVRSPSPPNATPQPRFDRPEGSFASRAFGNTVHAFLDQLTTRVAAGQSLSSLGDELPDWQQRILNVLRASGLPPSLLDRLTHRVIRALSHALTDPEGQWLLSAHPGGLSESGLLFGDDSLVSLRIDRTFLAGRTPLSVGESHRWIIDYKTAEAGGRDERTFLAEEKKKYAGQLEAYAAVFPHTQPICLALYYPMLPKLLWWENGLPVEESTATGQLLLRY